MENEYRYEVKVPTNDQHYDSIVQSIFAYTSLAKVYPDRYVNSIYFDSHSKDCLIENALGTANRFKVRMRWYGDRDSIIKPRLEFKIKSGGVNRKEVYKIDHSFVLSELSSFDLTERLKTSIGAEAALVLQLYDQPKLYCRYLREYFADSTGEVRLTIDRELSFACEELIFEKNYSEIFNDKLIVEFKCKTQDHSEISNLVQQLNLRPDRMSKYAYGSIHETYG